MNEIKIQHPEEPWQFHENGDGSFSILNHDKSKWVIGLHLNGEMLIEKQRAVMMRIVTCVNASKNVPNEWLQENAVYALIDRVAENERREAKHVAKLESERDELLEMLEYSLQAIKAVNSMGASKAIIERIEQSIAKHKDKK